MKKLEKTILALGLLMAACQPDSSTTEPEDGTYTPILVPQYIILTPVDGAAAGGAVQPVTLMGRAGAAQLSDGTPLFPGEVRVFSPLEQAVAGTASAGSFGALVDADSTTDTIELIARDPATGLQSEPVRVTVPRLGPDSPAVLPEYDPDTGKGVFVDPDPVNADRVIVEGRGGSADAGAEILITNLDNGESTTATADGDGNFKADIKADPNDTIVVIQTKNDKPGPPLVLPAPPRQCPDERMQVLFGKCRLVSAARPDLIEVPGTAVDPFAVDATNGIAFVSPVYLLTVDGDYQFVKPFDMDLNWAGDLPLDDLQNYVRLYFAPRNANDNRWHERAGVEMGLTRRRVSTEASQLGFFRVGIAVEHLCENHFERNLDPLCFNNTGPGNSANACAWLSMVLEQCGLQTCGDGFINLPDEECDDHNTTDGDGCSATCEAEGCGDGVVQAETGETCDDANEINTDACPNGCREARCGDGVVWQGVETCDDGVLNGQPGRCAAGCAGMVAAVCGNRVLEGGEACDDGNSTGGDGCSANCTVEACGNGVLDQGEGCDDGNTVGGDGCAPHCRNERCGDGTVQASEACDDNNKNPGDGCDENCLTEACGNGIVQASEACDDGDTDESDACLNDCRWNLCGDGKLYTGIEVCDGGSIACNDGCYDGTRNCYTDCTGYAPCDPLPQRCGNGNVEGCELCDDGDLNGQPNQCDATCTGGTGAICGNGALEIGEVCDDGANGDACDGCLDDCKAYTPDCGDGVAECGEICDDGANGDACDGCLDNCTAHAVVCGDGVAECGEVCDDGAGNGSMDKCNQICGGTCIMLPEPGISTRFGDGPNQEGYSLAVDSHGNVWMSGIFNGTVDFGGGPLVSAGEADFFLAKFAPNGTHLFSARFGNANNQSDISPLAVDSGDNVWMTGGFSGVVDFGGGPLGSAGGTDIFLAKFAPNGTHLYSTRFGDSSDERSDALAVDSGGNVWFTGHFYNTVDFGGGPLVSAGGWELFLAKLAPNGAHLYSARFGDNNDQSGNALAVDSGGNVWLTGFFYGAVNFGGGPLVNSTGGGFDIFLAKFAPNGAHLYSVRFGSAGNDRGNSLTVDAGGNVWMTGGTDYAADFGGGTVQNGGIFLAKFAPNGAHLYSAGFSSVGEAKSRSLAVDGGGNVWMTGYFDRTVDFGGGPLVSSQVSPYAFSPDAFLAKFAPNGAPLYSARFGDANPQFGNSLAVDAGDSVWMTGYFYGAVTFGGNMLASAGLFDIFIAKFATADAPNCHVCGDGIVSGVEVCDDGASNGMPNLCNLFCTDATPANCGNFFVEPGEACDDGSNGDACDGCLDNCTAHAPICGDGIAECGEACDDGVGGACLDDCSGANLCGNGVVDAGETCDEGTLNGEPCRCLADCSAMGGFPTQNSDAYYAKTTRGDMGCGPVGALDTRDIDFLLYLINNSLATPSLPPSMDAGGLPIAAITSSDASVWQSSMPNFVPGCTYDPPYGIVNLTATSPDSNLSAGSSVPISADMKSVQRATSSGMTASFHSTRGKLALMIDTQGGACTFSGPDTVAACPAPFESRLCVHPGNYGPPVASVETDASFQFNANCTPGTQLEVYHPYTNPCTMANTPGSQEEQYRDSEEGRDSHFWLFGDCGNGVTESGEVCDDGANGDACDGCMDDCTAYTPTCGDGIVECGEACDDGDTSNCTAVCNDACTGPAPAPVCGNGVTECGETCDDGLSNGSCGYCATSCQVPAHCDPLYNNVALGYRLACGIREDGIVDCWGSNDGQRILADEPFAAVSLGWAHALAVRSDGSLRGYGQNTYGEATPPGGTFLSVSAGNAFNCGIRPNSTLECWGASGEGQTSAPTGTFTKASAGNWHACGIRSDGSLACWGRNTKGQANAPAGTFIDVAAGYEHSCAVRDDHSLLCWGTNSQGQSSPPGGSYLMVVSKTDFSCALTTDGLAACWGPANDYGLRSVPNNTFADIAIGNQAACGLAASGQVVCWGSDDKGLATPPGGNYIYVGNGHQDSCTVGVDHSLKCWGHLSEEVKMAPLAGSFSMIDSDIYVACGIKTNNLPQCWRGSLTESWGAPFTPPNIQLKSLSVGGWTGCGITFANGLVCWGDPKYLGSQYTPPSGLFTVVSVAEGHMCALSVNNDIYCWGQNNGGELSVPPGVKFTDVSAGLGQTCGLRDDGTITCWGRSEILNPPSGSFTKVRSGAGYACALRSNGHLACWGQLVLPSSLYPDEELMDFEVVPGGSVCTIQPNNELRCMGQMVR